MDGSSFPHCGIRGPHSRSPLLRLQSDERLVALVRCGHIAAFEVLVVRYNGRLLSFCRHLLGSQEDAEDVLQEVLAAAFKAIIADERHIHVRPWLYRIARNRSLNHLRKDFLPPADPMEIQLSEAGATTVDEVQRREDFRTLVDDIRTLPETQRTALVLREMESLSYEQIAATMDTTVPGVKSLLVRARGSLIAAAEARHISCEQVRLELREQAGGRRRRPSAAARRHLRGCERCAEFRSALSRSRGVPSFA